MRLNQFEEPQKVHDAPLKPFCWTVYIEGTGATSFEPFVDDKVEVQIPLLNAAIDNVRALKIEGDRISFLLDICLFSTDRHTAAKEIRSAAVAVDVTGLNATLNFVEPTIEPTECVELSDLRDQANFLSLTT